MFDNPHNKKSIQRLNAKGDHWKLTDVVQNKICHCICGSKMRKKVYVLIDSETREQVYLGSSCWNDLTGDVRCNMESNYEKFQPFKSYRCDQCAGNFWTCKCIDVVTCLKCWSLSKVLRYCNRGNIHRDRCDQCDQVKDWYQVTICFQCHNNISFEEQFITIEEDYSKKMKRFCNIRCYEDAC
jgi:hypothetical protein